MPSPIWRPWRVTLPPDTCGSETAHEKTYKDYTDSFLVVRDKVVGVFVRFHVRRFNLT
jgi:hypothetical protein